MRESIETRRMLAFYGAFCLFLSTVELAIPKPLPFMRIGLANLPILMALRTQRPRFILALSLVKILGQGLVGGTFFSYIFLFSAVGSLASALVMLGLHLTAKEAFSLVGLGVSGALASNLAQVYLARYFLLGRGAWLIAPPFLLVGGLSGVLLGAFAQKLWESSPWLRSGGGS